MEFIINLSFGFYMPVILDNKNGLPALNLTITKVADTILG